MKKSHVEIKPLEMNSEHQTVRSRLTGKEHEIKFGPMPAAANPVMGGKVPANPFVSQAQAGYLHMRPDVLGKSALAEWDKETKGKHLPKHVKK